MSQENPNQKENKLENVEDSILNPNEEKERLTKETRDNEIFTM